MTQKFLQGSQTMVSAALDAAQLVPYCCVDQDTSLSSCCST